MRSIDCSELETNDFEQANLSQPVQIDPERVRGRAHRVGWGPGLFALRAIKTDLSTTRLRRSGRDDIEDAILHRLTRGGQYVPFSGTCFHFFGKEKCQWIL